MARRGKGEGSISYNRKLGRWWGRVTIGYDAKGNAKRKVVYGRTREEAAAKLAKLVAAKHDGMLPDPHKMTVAECLERYVANKVNADEATRYKNRCELRPLLDQFGPKVKVQALRPTHLRDAYSAMSHAGLSIRAQQRAAMHLKAALREAVHDGIVPRNVAEAVKVSAPRVDQGSETVQAWSPEEVDLFLEAARGELAFKPTGGKKAKDVKPEVVRVPPDKAKPSPLYPVFYLMLSLGLRRSEALGLPWKAVDIDAGKLSVIQALSPVDKGSTFALKPVKTSNSRRTLYLPQDVLDLLKGHKARQDELKAFMGSAWQETGLVFTMASGKAVGPRNALRTFTGLVEKAGVTPIRLHDLRHTHASLALQRGVPVEVVSERLGHARVDITLNIYRHLYEAERQAAALSLTEMLGRQERPRVVN